MMRLNIVFACVIAVSLSACVDGVTPPALTARILVEGGVFAFGSEEPCFNASQTIVTCGSVASGMPRTWPIAKIDLHAFYIDEHEVTNFQYEYCVAIGKCQTPEYFNVQNIEDYYGNPMYYDYPVVNITSSMAEEYCTFAGGRLPNEVEWERAAGGKATPLKPKRLYPTEASAAQIRNCDSQALKIDVSHCVNTDQPQRVKGSSDDFVMEGTGKIYDLAGNVSEWTSGRYKEAVTCAAQLADRCDCWDCQPAQTECKEDCYTTCTECIDDANCYVMCEQGGLGFPVCIAYSGPVTLDQLVNDSPDGERLIKGGNYLTTDAQTCQMTVANRSAHDGLEGKKPTLGFRCVYDVQ